MWEPGLVGVSDGVMSVISDYCRPAPPLLRGYSPDIQRNKFLKLDRYLIILCMLYVLIRKLNTAGKQSRRRSWQCTSSRTLCTAPWWPASPGTASGWAWMYA